MTVAFRTKLGAAGRDVSGGGTEVEQFAAPSGPSSGPFSTSGYQGWAFSVSETVTVVAAEIYIGTTETGDFRVTVHEDGVGQTAQLDGSSAISAPSADTWERGDFDSSFTLSPGGVYIVTLRGTPTSFSYDYYRLDPADWAMDSRFTYEGIATDTDTYSDAVTYMRGLVRLIVLE